MKLSKIIIFLFGVVLLITFSFFALYNDSPLYATQGKIDIQDTTFPSEKFIPLDGVWEFYSGQLYEPQKITEEIINSAEYIHVPGKWTTEDEDIGFGTYRLVIDNVPTNQVLGIKKQNIRSASKIFINGKLLSEEGIVGKQQTNYSEGNIPKLIFFQPDQEQLEIMIQVTDFSLNSAGISNSIYFGEQTALVNDSFRKVIFELGILAILLTIGMIYIFLYLFVVRYSRKEFFILAFALSCIFFALINLCLSERSILYILPDLSFETLFKIKDTSIFLATISLILIITQIDKRLLSPLLKYLLIFSYTFYVLVILLTTANFYYSFLPIFISLNCFIYVYIMVRMLYFYFKKSNVKRDPQDNIIMFSMLNINIYNINLLLYSFGFTTKLQLGFLNILLYAIALAIYLTVRVNNSYKRNDILTHELDVTEQAYLVAQIKPHFFFNTLTSVMSLCYTDGKKAAQLLAHFSSFLRHSFEFNSQEVFVSVEKEIKLLNSYIAIEEARFGEKLNIEFNVDPEILTESIIPLSIQPLVENAINHGIYPKEDCCIIRVSVNKIHSHLVVTVYDTGVGIPEDKIPELLDISKQKESGIGIANINKRLSKYYDTQLIIESKLGSWTQVSFEIPLHS